MANKFVSFFEKIGSALKKLFTNTTFEQQISSTIKYVAPLVETILTFTVGQPAEQVVAGIISEVQTDLATAYATVQGATVAAGSPVTAVIAAAFASVKANLASLLADAEVKNSTKVADITSAVNLIDGEVTALLSNLPTSPTA